MGCNLGGQGREGGLDGARWGPIWLRGVQLSPRCSGMHEGASRLEQHTATCPDERRVPPCRQVASHAQKYFLRQEGKGDGKQGRRVSIHDIAASDGAMRPSFLPKSAS